MKNQTGQTLIETLVASFILVMGIAAALALANYSFSAVMNISKQTAALGLAREGIEVVKNMRDTNWLRGTFSTDCYNFDSPADNNAFCYRDWLNPYDGTGRDLSPNGSTTYSLTFNFNSEIPWILTPTTKDFGLNLSDEILKGNFTQGPAYYDTQGGIVASTSNSGFARKITISEDTFPPFNQDTGTRLKVTSEVWWKERNCPMVDDVDPNSRCLIKLETYLTNWRNF
jgi:type II secretory pathway pseudopilin PulG